MYLLFRIRQTDVSGRQHADAHLDVVVQERLVGRGEVPLSNPLPLVSLLPRRRRRRHGCVNLLDERKRDLECQPGLDGVLVRRHHLRFVSAWADIKDKAAKSREHAKSNVLAVACGL